MTASASGAAGVDLGEATVSGESKMTSTSSVSCSRSSSRVMARRTDISIDDIGIATQDTLP
jgi:hypothetical protein